MMSSVRLMALATLAVLLTTATPTQGWRLPWRLPWRKTLANAADKTVEGAGDLAETAVRYAVVHTSAEEVCYKVLGCLSLKSPWESAHRPFPKPKDPVKVNTTYALYTRARPKPFYVSPPTLSLAGSDFNARRQTFIVTHGFMSNGNSSWVLDLKDAILGQVDGNVFLVDWKGGADDINYLQAAANTRIVGAEITVLVRNLIQRHRARPSQFHLLGHSLGAHISGYAARNVTGLGRVTGLDPAGPGFQELPAEVRLTSADAVFVDAIHTDGKTAGFGLMDRSGHVDFYMNGGKHQPGCNSPDIEAPSNIADIVTIPFEAAGDVLTCSHGRSHDYFTAALRNPGCRMWGHPTAAPVGQDDVAEADGPCRGRCVPIGLDTQLYSARGTFYVRTGSDEPFCLQDSALGKTSQTSGGVGSSQQKPTKTFFGRIWDRLQGILG